MAAFNRLKEATYEVHESVKVDTQDNEDHTFCGIMFPLKCKDLLPVDHISIGSVAVRGQLGPLTVWVSKDTNVINNNNNNRRNGNDATSTFRLTKAHWTKVYQKTHAPSQTEYVRLELDQNIILKPGQVRALYIHSTLPGDQAIVYDNAAFYFPRGPFGRHGYANNNSRRPRYEDNMIQIHTGRAHVSTSIFGNQPIWGWGNAWRDHREFVGQIHYGAVYKLWNPETQIRFGPNFKEAFFNLKLCQTRWESPISRLPDECIFYILNMCRWDWFQDSQATMTTQYREQKEKQRLLQQEQALQTARAEVQAMVDAAEAAPACQQHKCNATNNDNSNDNDSDVNSEGHYEDAMESLVDAEVEILANNDDDDVEGEGNQGDADDDVDWMEDDSDEELDSDEEDDWEAANGYRADNNVFRFVDPELEEENEGEAANSDEDEESATHQAWIRRQFQRIHVLRALARQQDDDEDVVDVHFGPLLP